YFTSSKNLIVMRRLEQCLLQTCFSLKKKNFF
ncbi:hypothetical protein A5868_001523, partial [Enterococcus sp. 12F9_DIV0723]